MFKKSSILVLVAVSVFAYSSAVFSGWDNPDDIPVTGPVTVGLAGERPADIVRFLMANGAKEARLSPDGSQLAYEWSITGKPQLWIVNIDEGLPRQITFGREITLFR